jgi:hypothetical protein
MSWETDTEREEVTIDRVEDQGDYWMIARSDIGCFNFKKSFGVTPEVGQQAIFFGRGFGSVVRGLVIAGRVVFYRTESEQKEFDRKEQGERDAQSQKEYELDKPNFDRRISALPECFRKRFETFRERSPEFGWKFEGYELQISELADQIANKGRKHEGAASFDEWFKRLCDAEWEEQQSLIGPMPEGLTGNMVNFAIRQAGFSVRKPEFVAKDHGALCILVGCEGFKACDVYWAGRRTIA